MDEGGFILDYVMPAGSSLASTGKVLDHVEQILHNTPEVESTSRRTGLQMGLAAVTEANTGDITVKLKQKRSRGIDEVIADVRKQIKQTEPAARRRVHPGPPGHDRRSLQRSRAHPDQALLHDPALLNELGPRVADEIGKVNGVVDVENGIDNTVSGPATNFEVDSQLAARLGFTTQEVAEDATSILDGVEVATPVIATAAPTPSACASATKPASRSKPCANTVFNSTSGHTASLGSMATITQLPPQNEIRRENLQRLVVVTGRLEGTDLGTAVKQVQAARPAPCIFLPASASSTAAPTRSSRNPSRDLARVLLWRWSSSSASCSPSSATSPRPPPSSPPPCSPSPASSALSSSPRTTFNVASFMGLIMVIGIVAKNGILLLDADERYRAEGRDAREAMVMAAQRRLRPILMTALAAVTGMLPLALALGAGSQMLQPLAIAVIGGLVISMLLSLIVTPVVYFLLTRHTAPEAAVAA